MPSTFTLQLDEELTKRLVELAHELQVDPVDLAKAAIADLFAHPSDDFERAAQHVLQKKREIFRRLA